MADFFNEDTPHGWLKRVIYKKYLQAYVAKILNFNLNVVLIDGFAGEGRYGSEWRNEIESYGSPLIMIMVVLQFYCNFIDRKNQQTIGSTWTNLHETAIRRFMEELTEEGEEVRRPELVGIGKTYIYLVENKPKNFKALRRNIQLYLGSFFRSDVELETSERDKSVVIQVRHPQFPITISISRVTFDEFQRERFHNSKTLTILDPFGYSHTPMQHVQEFVDQTSEVLISFMSGFVNRFCRKNPGSVAELYGIDRPSGNLEEFLRIVRDNAKGSTAENPKSCTKSYIEHMKRRTGSAYAQFYEMRGKRNNVIYHLIHFANHDKALEAMKETLNTCTQYEGVFKMTDYKVLVEGIPLELGNAQNEEELARTIFGEYCGKTVKLVDVKNFVFEHTPFVFRKNALKLLEKQTDPKIINVVDSRNSTEKRRKWTYPDWGDWKLTFRGSDT
ncbi:uncharacterized protein LOC128206975 [Mya arenaria]|uniref:uncharacterized protein LOC128206975 n=1 Tax=Mya arenaria TaxID=6604 RepID=UPI0022E7A1B8|nr:uncharacterized protein LOC128206975 [Mya arenaria]XP_052765700.1 uncharacterized protein LOC128206975 [Mya arenaria]